MYLVVKVDGAWRLCQDFRWRSFANFGTYPECVKVYKSIVAATNRARATKGQVAAIDKNMSVDAAGNILNEITGQRVAWSSVIVYPVTAAQASPVVAESEQHDSATSS